MRFFQDDRLHRSLGLVPPNGPRVVLARCGPIGVAPTIGRFVDHEALCLATHVLPQEAQPVRCRWPARATGMLTAFVENKRAEKHHVFLREEPVDADDTSSSLDSEGVWQIGVRLRTVEPKLTIGTDALSSEAAAAARTLPGTA